MALKDILKVNRKTFFNPRGWLGYDSLKNSTKFTVDTIKSITVPDEATRTETFEQAQARMHLTDADIAKTAELYTIYTYLFLGLGVLALAYAFYLAIQHHSITGFALALAVCALLLVNAFRFNFWLFQIKHRKLGCTFDEWWQGKLNPGNPHA